MELIAWLIEHWDDIIQLYLAAVGVASIVVKLTPTLKDDHYLKAFMKFTGRYIALNKTISSKEQKEANSA